MRKILINLSSLGLLCLIPFLSGCDWSSGSQDNFNTSGGSSVVNISGFYEGTLGGRAVANTSNGNINSFTIQQSGNRIEVVDNQGSRYTGSIGTPRSLIPPGATTIPDGALAAVYQVSFTGKDNVAARDIEFSGVINVVAISDIVSSSNTSSNTNTTQDDTTTTTTSSSTSSISIPQQDGVDGVEPGIDETVTTTTSSTTGSTNGTNNTSSSGRTFQLTDQNAQNRLEGTWVEIGGVVSDVDAIGSGVQGNIVVEEE